MFQGFTTKMEIRAMMVFLTDGDFWPRPPRDCLCGRTHRQCVAMEIRCNKCGDRDRHKEDDHRDGYEYDGMGTPEPPDLLPSSFLNTNALKHAFPSQELASVSHHIKGFPQSFFRRREKQGNNSINHFYPEQTPSPEALQTSPTSANPAVRSRNPRLAISTGLESGVSQDFMEDLKDAVAYVLQKESERGTDFLTVATMLDQQVILIIKDIRKMEFNLASGMARCAPPLTSLDPEANGFSPVYDTFRRQFDKAFERALEKERDFKRAFPGAPASLRTQVIETLRRLRKAVQGIPDQVARHKMLMASIRSYRLGLKNAHSTMGREREKEGREARGSLRLRTSSRHCQRCLWRVHASLKQECEVCAYWRAPSPRGESTGGHSKC